MKKIIATSIMILIILSNITVFASSNVEFSIENKENVKSGDTINLKIKTANIEGQEKKISGIKLDIFYDKNDFEFVSAEQLDAANGTICLHENYADEGRIRIGAASLTGLKKSGEMYQIVLKAKERNKQQRRYNQN